MNNAVTMHTVTQNFGTLLLWADIESLDIYKAINTRHRQNPTDISLFPSKLAIKGFFECPGDVTFLFKLFLWPFYFFYVNPDAP